MNIYAAEWEGRELACTRCLIVAVYCVPKVTPEGYMGQLE